MCYPDDQFKEKDQRAEAVLPSELGVEDGEMISAERLIARLEKHKKFKQAVLADSDEEPAEKSAEVSDPPTFDSHLTRFFLCAASPGGLEEQAGSKVRRQYADPADEQLG